MNLHDLIEDLSEYLSLSPEQQFRVTAKIKRLLHNEKLNVYSRLAFYARGVSKEPKDPKLLELLQNKVLDHEHLRYLVDEELVTWNVGSHTYKANE